MQHHALKSELYINPKRKVAKGGIIKAFNDNLIIVSVLSTKGEV
jgi:hypothetical protein